MKTIEKSKIMFAECIEISDLNEFTEKFNVDIEYIIFNIADSSQFEKCFLYQNINIPTQDFNTFCSVIEIKKKERESLKFKNFLRNSSVYDKIRSIKKDFINLENYINDPSNSKLKDTENTFKTLKNIKEILNSINCN